MYADITGQRFGRLLVVNGASRHCECLCDCGNTKQIYRGSLLSGDTQSCRCLHREIMLNKHKEKRMTVRDDGRVLVISHGHPRASKQGYVFRYILVAEKAAGFHIKVGHPIHHANEISSDDRNENLVICENQSYHKLLHSRTATLRAGGDPNKEKFCRRCQKTHPFSAFRLRVSTGYLNAYCRSCERSYR